MKGEARNQGGQVNCSAVFGIWSISDDLLDSLFDDEGNFAGKVCICLSDLIIDQVVGTEAGGL
jgi:hypothetical protein